jgi:protein involved in polysaccharide export with SLBB domain
MMMPAPSRVRIFLCLASAVSSAAALGGCHATPAVAQLHSSVALAASTHYAAPLQTGDVIRIKVWREPDLSGDVTVGDDGMAPIPKLGNVAVASLTLDTIRRRIVEEYSKTLANPAIEVLFLRRLRVFGAVHTPGLYPVEDGLTVADAIALAGGVADDGSYNNVLLVRGSDHSSIRVTSVMRLADIDINSGDEVFVPQRSWASRNSATLVQSILTAVAILFAGGRL